MDDFVKQRIDELMEKHKGSMSTYYGVPMDEFSKDQLLAIIEQIGVEQLEREKEKDWQRQFFSDIRN